MSRYLTTTAITLRVQSRREDDRLYTLYVRGLGVVEAVAEGSAKPTSKLAGHLEPFGEVVVTLVRRGDVRKLTGAVCRTRFRNIASTAWAMETAGFCLRLARTVARVNQPDAGMYVSLRVMLEAVDAMPARDQSHVVSVAYAMHALTMAGLQPQFDHCGQCRREMPHGFFDAAAGVLRCPRCAEVSPALPMVNHECLKFMQLIMNTPLPEALRIRCSPAAAVAARGLLDRFLEYHTDAEIRATSIVRS